MSDNRFITAIFCDDVRQEAGNKYSIMGCFDRELILNSFPSQVNKFCAVITSYTPLDKPFKQLSIKILVCNEIAGEAQFPEDSLKKIEESATEANFPGKRVGLRIVANFSPMIFEKPGFVEIVAVTEQGELRGPLLQIRQFDQSTDSNLGQFFGNANEIICSSL